MNEYFLLIIGTFKLLNKHTSKIDNEGTVKVYSVLKTFYNEPLILKFPTIRLIVVFIGINLCVCNFGSI